MKKGKLFFCGKTDMGKCRTNNEDAFLVHQLDDNTVLAVAIDGVGGYEGGEVAAEIAKDEIMAYLSEFRSGNRLELLKNAVANANNAICEHRKYDYAHSEMCCVLTSALIDKQGETVDIVHVGDSRMYRYHDGTLQKLTSDHSPVGFMEDSGFLTEEEAMHHPHRNLIDRCVGSDVHLADDPDFLEAKRFVLQPDSIYLLCSDGLTDMVTSAQIVSILGRSASLDEKASALIDAANQAGGKDNVTVVLVEYLSDTAKDKDIKPVPVMDFRYLYEFGDSFDERPGKITKFVGTRHIVYFSDLLPMKCPNLFVEILKVLWANGVEVVLLNNTKDIWCRDYMPIEVYGNYVTFKYNPDYLDTPYYRRTITDIKAIKGIDDIMNRVVDNLDLVLDGGNVVQCDGRVVMTEKVFFDNKDKPRNKVISMLEDAFMCELVVLPWDRNEIMGHSDGIVHYVGNYRLLLTNYEDFSPYFYRKFRKVLDPLFEVVPLKYKSKPMHRRSWAYVNFLKLGNLVLVPQLGIPEDEEALQQISAAIPEGKVVGIPSIEAVRKGGALNCISWNITYDDMDLHMAKIRRS